MNKSIVRKLRCAVYTRKSSEEGLEQEFDSLHAQREACEAYIASQRSEGWVLVRDQYDDGGISGGTLERPGLKRLLADVEDGLIDVVVVYKIDRLSRSLMDFSKLVEVFDRNGVTFVSVTQSFNTTTSMGRLTLNILLSFAQFEREVTAERIRDKVKASRMKGMWMGGVPPLGYEVKDRKLIIKEADAANVRWIFARFIEIGSATELAWELAARGIQTSRGNRIDKKYLYRLLNNRAYIGEAVHKGNSYPGEHDAIIDRDVWDKVHAILTESPRKRAARTRADTPALLKGLLYGPDGAAFSPTHTRKGGKLYRYYVSPTVLKHGAGSCPVGRVEAIEQKLRKRAAWVTRQQRYFTQFLPRTPERNFIAGETHLYLGRQYRLKVVPNVQESVKLIRGYIVVQTHRPTRTDITRELVEGWYRNRAHIKFGEQVEQSLQRFPDPEAFRPKGMIIRQMKQRWGSMSPAHRLLLNRRLVEAPVDAIDYVITHELCHIAEPHHGTAFFDLLDRVMPDWERRKQRLERIMA